jgi:hypothetical protein
MSITREQIEQPANDIVERSPIGDVPDTSSVEGSDTATRETAVRQSEQTSRQPEEQRGANGEGTAMPTPSFGGLSPAEAGRRSAAKRKERLAQAPDTDEEEAHLRKLARGDGMVALKAIELLAKREGELAQRANDQGLLALLTPEQRDCIEAVLRGHREP